MPLPVLAQVDDCLVKADVAAAAALDPVQDFLRVRTLGQSAQLSSQELLQRLPALLGAALEGRVHVVRKVADQQVRHAYIMQASGSLEQLMIDQPDCGGPSCRIPGRVFEVDNRRQWSAVPNGVSGP
jgi:hypothetical protein